MMPVMGDERATPLEAEIVDPAESGEEAEIVDPAESGEEAEIVDPAESGELVESSMESAEIVESSDEIGDVTATVLPPVVVVRVGAERNGVRHMGTVLHKRVQAHTDDPPPAHPQEELSE